MHEPINWAPSAPLSHLLKRATIMAHIRHFFSQRGLLEVETPVLSQASVTDVHLHTFITAFNGPGEQSITPLYLTTSPEFHMKRLLAAGSGPIFQLSKSFRNEERGCLHNPEFTLLEWYQPGYTMHQLMDEIETLLQHILSCKTAEKLSYQQVFLHYLALDPLTTDREQLQQRALDFNPSATLLQTADCDILLQFLFNVAIEPHIGHQQPLFIYHFPATQAALAQISPHDKRVAERFELYYRGIELANGFHELTDAQEQQQRFEQDNAKRQAIGLATQPIDWRLLAALQAGLPDCSGVALGVDRLIMLALNASSIKQVIAFESAIA